MNIHKATLIAAVGGLLLVGCFDPIVGAECADNGLVECAGTCVDPSEAPAECSIPDDPPNDCVGDDCVDPPDDCDDETCATPSFGHVVLIGHDYSDAGDTVVNRILGNAVFIARGGVVDVAVYEGAALPGSVGGVRAAIDQVAAEVGRTWKYHKVGNADAIEDSLVGADVFVIHSQAASRTGDDTLLALGAGWRSALEAYMLRGGIVVLLDGASAHSGTVQVLSAAGLVGYDTCKITSVATLTVVDATDAVSVGLPSSYPSDSATRFDGADEGVVVSDGLGPVVVHLIH